MPTQAATSEIARDINRRIVLNLIRTRQPISRADLARIIANRQQVFLVNGSEPGVAIGFFIGKDAAQPLTGAFLHRAMVEVALGGPVSYHRNTQTHPGAGGGLRVGPVRPLILPRRGRRSAPPESAHAPAASHP